MNAQSTDRRTTAVIPGRFPAVTLDKIIASAEELHSAELMIHLEMEFAHRIDTDRLSRAFDLLCDAQPVLGCRFITDTRTPYWKRVEQGKREILLLTSSTETYNAFRVSRLDSRTGVQIKACLHHAAQGDRLLLKVTHLLCDAGGLKDIAADLSTIYARLKDDPHYKASPNLTGSRGCDQIIRQLPWNAYPAIILNVLRIMWSNQVPPETHTLSLPGGEQSPCAFFIRNIPASRTERLRQYGKQHQATLNDVMLTAFQRALTCAGKWDGKAVLRMQMIIDLRRWYLPGQRAEGICNLSGYEYTNLGTHLGNSFASTLERISTTTRQRKENWFGLTDNCCALLLNFLPYRVLVKIAQGIDRKALARRVFPNGLSNAGPIQPEKVVFDEKPLHAWILPPIIYPPRFGAVVSSYAGTLTLSSGGPVSSKPYVEQFFDCMLAELPE